jgi:hypothetical protein
MLATDAAGKAPKISLSHLERLAYVYVRQSTAGQVRRWHWDGTRGACA